MWKLCGTVKRCTLFCLIDLPKNRQWEGRRQCRDFPLAYFLLILTILMPFIVKDAMAQSETPVLSSRLQKKITALPPGVRIIKRPEDGTVSYIQGSNLTSILEKDKHFQALQSAGEPVAIAIAFLNAYKDLFGIENPEDEFVLKLLNHDDLGYSQVRLYQVFLGMPVWSSEVLIQLNQDNHISLVQGQYIKTPLKLNVSAKLSEKHALQVVAKKVGIGSECHDCELEIIIFKAQGKKPMLAYKVSVTVNLLEGWEVIVDANSGLILNTIPTVYSGSVEGKV